MKNKNDVEVLINGRRYTICGFESAEYLQRVATYINSKFSEFKNQDYYYGLDMELRNILLAINIADDYFKSEKEKKALVRDNARKDKMVLDMKHEVLDMQSHSNDVSERKDELRGQLDDAEKKIVELNVKNEGSSTKLVSLEETLAAVRTESSSLAARLETAREQVKKLESENARLKKKNDSLSDKVKTQGEKLKAAAAEKKAMKEEFQATEKELGDKLQASERYVLELEPQVKRLAECERENAELKAKTEAAERRIQDLETRTRKGKR